MATEKFVTESSLSSDAAFARMIDLERVPEWDKGIRSSRLVQGESGSVGARYELGLDGFDRQPTIAVYEITAVDGRDGFTMVGNHPEFRAEDTLRFDSLENGCIVTYIAELTLLGDAPPVGEEHLAKIFAKLVAVAEAGVHDYLNE